MIDVPVEWDVQVTIWGYAVLGRLDALAMVCEDQYAGAEVWWDRTAAELESSRICRGGDNAWEPLPDWWALASAVDLVVLGMVAPS